MKRLFEMVREFHKTYGCPISDNPTIVSAELQTLREDLLREEYYEYFSASHNQDIVGIADSLGDMVYVIVGTALAYGIPLDEVLEEIHRSNMSKLGVNGEVLKRSDGKVIKGPNYTPPDIASILKAHS